MLKIKRIIALSISFLLLLCVIKVEATPRWSGYGNSRTFLYDQFKIGANATNKEKWQGLNRNAMHVSNAIFTNSNNGALTVESAYSHFCHSLKETSRTSFTVYTQGGSIAATSCPSDNYYSSWNGTSLNLATNVKNWRWFKLTNSSDGWVLNNSTKIIVKISNLKIYNYDSANRVYRWMDVDMYREISFALLAPASMLSSKPINSSGKKNTDRFIALGKGLCDTVYIGCGEVETINKFYKANTAPNDDRNKIKIATNITLTDIDSRQYACFWKDDTVRQYVTPNTVLYYSNVTPTGLGSVTNPEYNMLNIYHENDDVAYSDDPRTHVSFLFEGDEIEYRFGRTGNVTMQEQYLGSRQDNFVFEPQPPAKTVTDDDEIDVKSNSIRDITKDWTYNVTQAIPEMNNTTFSQFEIGDSIDKCLDIENVSIEASDGETVLNADGWFDISTTQTYDGKTSILAKLKSTYRNSSTSNFYKYISYTMKIKVKPKIDNSKTFDEIVEDLENDGHFDSTKTKLIFNNTGYSIINGTTRNTSEVYTTVNLPTKGTDTPGLKITKVADKFEYQVGDKIHYTVEVSNTNPEADTAYFKIKDDTLPNTVEVDSDSFEINGISASNYDFEVDNNNWQLTSNADYALPYGSTIEIEFDATALKPSNSHLVDNAATAFAFGVGEHQAEAEVWVNSPKLNVTKVADKTRFNLGDEITYTVEATNINEGTLAHLIFEDNITSTGVTYIANSVKVMGDDTDITNDCNISFNSTLSKLTIDTYHYLKNGDCELSNQKNFRGRIGYQNGIAPRSHNKITLTYKVKVVNADTSYGTALLLTDEKVLDNTVKAIPGAIYNYDGNTPAIIKDDSTIPSGGDEATEEITINDPELSITKESNKDAYKVNNIAYYTLTIKQTKTNLIARNIGIRDTFDKDDGITLNKDSIKVFLNNVDVTNSCIIIKTPSSAHTNEFYINTLKSISDQDELKVTYNAKVEKTGYYDNNVTVSSTNTDSVTDANEIEVQVNGLPMTGQERNLFFIFIGLGIVLTITLVIVRKKRKLSTK